MYLVRTLVQWFFIIAFCFFAWHFFTKPELHQCISLPVASLSGVTPKVNLDQAKVDHFLDELSQQLAQAGSKSNELLSHLSSIEATASDKPAGDELLDRGQYLYCKAVVDKVEKRWLNN